MKEIGALIVGVLFGVWAENQYWAPRIEEMRIKHTAALGFIGCVDGRFEMRNIRFEGERADGKAWIEWPEGVCK